MNHLPFCPICGKHKQIIFRRFRRTKDGQVLDAHWYGKKAWPIHICDC